MVPFDLAVLIQRERERDLADARLARHAACFRACCHPNRLDRVARALGVSPRGC
jgi:hypothetical protein